MQPGRAERSHRAQGAPEVDAGEQRAGSQQDGSLKRQEKAAVRAFPTEFQPSPRNSSHNTLSCHGFQQLPSPPSSCSCSSSSLPAPSGSPSLPSLSNPSPLSPNPAGTHSRAAPPPIQHLEKRDYGFKKEKQRAHPAPGATDNASNNKRNFHPAAEYSRFTSQALPGVPKEQLHLDFGLFSPPVFSHFSFQAAASPRFHSNSDLLQGRDYTDTE